MLGCQDFCGYYDWTFHYIRRRWGNQALGRFMSEAIGEESQSHYSKAAADGLRGLLQCWDKTGSDEHCDWTFRLDEQRNLLRWDMRQCPSKGYLLKASRDVLELAAVGPIIEDHDERLAVLGAAGRVHVPRHDRSLVQRGHGVRQE